MQPNRYNPNERTEPYRNIRFTVQNEDLCSLIREVEGRSGESAEEIAYESFVSELHDNYSHYLE